MYDVNEDVASLWALLQLHRVSFIFGITDISRSYVTACRRPAGSLVLYKASIRRPVLTTLQDVSKGKIITFLKNEETKHTT